MSAGRDGRGPQRLPALRGLVEAFRRIPSGLRRPETLMLLMALFASIGIHMPPYVGLGALADYWEQFERERKQSQDSEVEVSYEFNEPEPAAQPEPEPETEPDESPREQPVAERDPEPQKAKPKPKPKPKPEPELREKTAEVELQPPEKKRQQSITQKSDDPDVEEPEDARFLAEENRVVEEETVARVRDEVRDDPEPEAAAPEDRGVDEAGDDAEEKPSFSERGVEEEGDRHAQTPPRPEPPPREQPASAEPKPGREAVAEQAEQEPSQELPGTVIKDPLGSFTLATADEPRERREGREARRGGRNGPSGKGNPNLDVSWKVFEDTYDAETLARERVPQRRQREGSSQRNKRWKEFRAAIENYVVGVRPGNTTALNARADPFAAYIAEFHRHLHQEFAYRFLGGLPATGELADPSLVTRVEIVINPDGTLHRVGVVRSSGQMMFDFGAFNAVKSGEPYPRPPEKIRSPDGRVYLRWALHRNHSQCGTWNAEPYIVTNPPDVTDDPLPTPGMQLGPTRRGPG